MNGRTLPAADVHTAAMQLDRMARLCGKFAEMYACDGNRRDQAAEWRAEADANAIAARMLREGGDG